MKKKDFFTWPKLCGGLLFGAIALLMASCAVDGYDDETFASSVHDTELNSPDLSDDCFSTRMNSDGTESVVVEWDVVPGAGGYEYAAYNVDDPENPVELVSGIVDGVSFSFPKAEDTKYAVFVRTLGNEKLNNTEAPEPTVYNYTTLIDAMVIPNGSDIAEFIAANMKESDIEQAFELEAGGEYTCNGPVDFLNNKMTLRGDKIDHPLVTFGEAGVIYTSSQLKVKFINFDCSNMTNKWGVIEMSPNPPAEKSAVAQGIAAARNDNKPADVYILMDPIIVQECAFKNVPNCFFSVGKCSWGIADLRVLKSVIQMRNDGSKNANSSVFSAYSYPDFISPSGGQFWYGCIQNLTVTESTICNTVSNSKCFAIRFNNKDIDRCFPSANGTCIWKDNTFVRIFDSKNFADRTPNQSLYVITYDNNIFVDCYRLQKFIQGNCTVNYSQSKNVVYAYYNTLDATDKTKWGTEEDPGFTTEMMEKELDFSQPNYGLNFTATGPISSTIGDPRWKQ